MFIKLTNIISSDIATNVNKQISLSNLLRSHYSGFNITNIDIDDLNYIIKLNSLSKADIFTACDIKDTRREYGRIKKETTHYIIVDFALDNNIEKNETDGNQVFLYCSHHKFHDFDKAIACSLVSECETDIELYKIIGKYYSSAKINSSIPLNFKIEDGRGSGTKPIFDRLKNHGCMCLCLIDSDKKHPNGPLGGTAKAFTTHDLIFHGSTLTKIIESHEAESLLPYKAISSAMYAYSYSASKFDALDLMSTHSKRKPEIKDFIDHKKGICAEKYTALDKVYGKFWTELPEIIKYAQKKPHGKECDADCIVIEGLGDNILAHTLQELQRMTPFKVKESLEPILIPIWDDLGKLIFSWGCAPHKVQTRA
ncbi:hypothetical protein Aeroheme_01269 [Aeromonas sp. DSM 116730]|uniref:hypothetical protein n=1 Tax=Aeromonas sp. DSM 116730 TaxID=3115851 RepID=UPI003982D31B